MRYLVSGANGFIGRALCAQLIARGCRVRALLRTPCEGPWDEQVCCDLGRDPIPSQACRDIEGIFHLAGIAHSRLHPRSEASLYERVNVTGVGALLDVAEEAGVKRFVLFSSVKAAADPGEKCVDETWIEPPTDVYGQSKREAEQLALARTARGMHVSILRPTLVYGVGVKGNLRRMIEAIDAGRFPPLPDTHNRRSMVSVPDLVEAAWLAMTKDAANGRVFIVSDGLDYSTRALDLAIRRAMGRGQPSWSIPLWLLNAAARAGDLIERASGRSLPFSSAALSRLCGSACYRSDRLREALGWEPRTDFFTMLPDMLAIREERGGRGRITAPPAADQATAGRHP